MSIKASTYWTEIEERCLANVVKCITGVDKFSVNDIHTLCGRGYNFACHVAQRGISEGYFKPIDGNFAFSLTEQGLATRQKQMLREID